MSATDVSLHYLTLAGRVSAARALVAAPGGLEGRAMAEAVTWLAGPLYAVYCREGQAEELDSLWVGEDACEAEAAAQRHARAQWEAHPRYTWLVRPAPSLRMAGEGR
jgi:hypothetical protein